MVFKVYLGMKQQCEECLVVLKAEEIMYGRLLDIHTELLRCLRV